MLSASISCNYVLAFLQMSLREKCPNSFFWFKFSCIRTEYGDLLRKSPYLVRMQENTDQKKTPYLDTFRAVFTFSTYSNGKQPIKSFNFINLR